MHAILRALAPMPPAGENETLIVRTVENDLTETVRTPVRTVMMKRRVDTGGMMASAMNVLPRERREKEAGIIGNLLLTGDGPLRKNERVVISGALDETGAQTMREIVMTGRSARRKRSLRGWRRMSQVSPW